MAPLLIPRTLLDICMSLHWGGALNVNTAVASRKRRGRGLYETLGKALATAQAEQRSWSQELSCFLLSYRTSPHSSTKFPPAQLLFNRQVRGKLPVLNTKSNVINRHREARRNDAKQKQLAKQYADTRRHTKPSGIKRR